MSLDLWQRTVKECRNIRTSLVDLLFPQVCLVCERSLVRGEKYLCSHCLADFPFTDEDLMTGEKVLGQFDDSFRPEKLHSLFYYNKYSDYKNLIYAVKYHSYQQLGAYLGRMLGEKIKYSCQADCIIPIPLHPKREKERGFNQAFEIARGLREVLGIELLGDVVIRVKNNVSQTGKNAAERQKNVRDIFQLLQASQIIGRHVLLVDDVITTGATIGSCLQVLAGAGQVKFSLGCLAQTV